MKKLKVLQIVLNSIIFLAFLAVGITIIVLGAANDAYDEIMLGIILLLAGVSRIAIYFVNHGYRESVNFNLLVGIAFLIFGIIFLVSKYDIEVMCFGWGVLEIFVGAIEIHSSIYTFKQDKLSAFEIFISIGGIVFGILLCIEKAGGLTGHLIYMGVSIILMAILSALRIFFELRNNE